MYTISQLFIYPVKSLGGFEIVSAELTDKGFRYDRRWMIVDGNNRFLTQREFPEMCLLQTAIENNLLIIFDKNNTTDRISVPLQNLPSTTVKVNIWEDECTAQFVSDTADKWLSNKLNMQSRLVYMPDSEKRKVDERFAQNNEVTNFSDGYPLMMIGEESLNDLNKRLIDPIPMDRFRPNIVFTGGQAFDEDIMQEILINKIAFYGVKLSSRCVLTTINQSTAAKAKEPIKTLAQYRQKNNKIYFGQNVLGAQIGTISVGNQITVITKKPPLFVAPNQ